MKRSDAFTLVELLVVIGIITLLVTMLVPSLTRAKFQAQVATCKANLNGAVKGLLLYAPDYNGRLPTRGFNGSRFDEIGANVSSEVANASSNSRNLFIAVRENILQPKIFNCPATDDAEGSTGNVFDFDCDTGSNYKNKLSYSFHLQFKTRGGDKGYPLAMADNSQMAVLADKSPCVTYPGNNYLSKTIANTTDNSPNHEREGQNVGYLEGHVSWTEAPQVGVEGDNIYTVWAGDDKGNGAIAAGSMPQGLTDSFLVP